MALLYLYPMLWGILICLALIGLIHVAFKRLSFFKDTDLSTTYLSIAFFIKVGGAIALFLIYSLHYQDRANADIFKYYDDAVMIYSHPDWQITKIGELFMKVPERSETAISILEHTQHWDQQWKLLPNDNRLMILTNLLLLYISQGFYFFHLLIFSSLSFIGLIALFHFFKSLLEIHPKLLLALLILPPSTLLWTSGMLKESLFFFALGLLLHSLFKIKSKKPSWLMLLQLALLLALSIWIKTYLLICFIPALLIYLPNRRVKLKLNLLSTVFTILCITLLLWGQVEASLNDQLKRFTELAIEIQANTYFPIETRNGLINFLAGIPEAIYNVWLRPIAMWDRGFLSLINAAESLIYLLIPLLLIPFRRKSGANDLVFWMLISFILLTTIVIGSSIPVMGAVLRYRSPLIPFYLILLFTFVDTNQLKQRLKL